MRLSARILNAVQPPASSTPPTPPVAPTPTPITSTAAKAASSNGALDALQHTGIPVSWLKRPRLPSRNWLIFLGLVSSLTYAYVDDRRKARAIREEYVERVRHLADVPMGSMELPRKVEVFACKWPGDEDYDASMKFFRKYVKPVLVAAAVDYTTKNGNIHGALSELIAQKAKDHRRHLAGLSPPPSPWSPPTALTPEQEYERWMKGGTILIGRHSFKEYMHGLRRGWTEPLDAPDAEERLAERLADDGRFDEPEEEGPNIGSLDEVDSSSSSPSPSSSTPAKPPSSLFAPLSRPPSSPPSPPTPSSSPSFSQTSTPAPPPTSIPPQPPLLLVPYPVRLGFFNIPFIIYDFFNEKRNVRIGCEAAYKIVMGETRPFETPSSVTVLKTASEEKAEDGTASEALVGGGEEEEALPVAEGGDTSFDLPSESSYGRSFKDLPKVIAKARKEYYSSLPSRLILARSLARNEREPTSDETANPPKTEVELREERLKKEKKWMGDEGAWIWLVRGSGVVWDGRMGGEGVLRVFSAPGEETLARMAPPPPKVEEDEA